MITRQDIAGWITEIAQREMAMRLHYKQVAEQLNYAPYRDQFLQLAAQEQDHARAASKLLRMLKQQTPRENDKP